MLPRLSCATATATQSRIDSVVYLGQLAPVLAFLPAFPMTADSVCLVREEGSMSAIQKVKGSAQGVNIDEAIDAALKSSEAPGHGFDFQTLRVDEIRVTVGGFVNATVTEVDATVIDGSFESPSELPQPRFSSLDESPVISGGVSASLVAELEAKGWEARTLKGDRANVPVAFRSSDTPSGFVLRYGTIPDGTKVMENERLGQTIIMSCGNQCPIMNRDYVVGH